MENNNNQMTVRASLTQQYHIHEITKPQKCWRGSNLPSCSKGRCGQVLNHQITQSVTIFFHKSSNNSFQLLLHLHFRKNETTNFAATTSKVKIMWMIAKLRHVDITSRSRDWSNDESNSCLLRMKRFFLS